MRRIFIVVAVLTLLTAACKIETNVDASLNADGTGTVSYEVGLDDEAKELLLADGDPFEDVPEGSETETEERGDMTYYIATVEFSDAAELSRLMTEESNSPFATFTATFSESSVTVQGTTEDSGGGFFDEGEIEGFDPALIEESVSAAIRITMPGKVVQSNADETDGSTLSWEVPLFGGALEVRAESDPSQEGGGGGGGFPVWLIVVIAAVLGAGIMYFVVSQRRSRGATAAAASPEPAAAPGGDEPPPPPPPPPAG